MGLLGDTLLDLGGDPSGCSDSFSGKGGVEDDIRAGTGAGKGAER